MISDSSWVQNGKVNTVWREMRSVDLQDGVGASVRSSRGKVGLFRRIRGGGSSERGRGGTKQK